jgi:site-specific DNA-methyltransferase (adenine-specific)
MSRMNGGLLSSERGDWATPQAFFDLVDTEFGFTLDSAAEPHNAKCARYYTEADSGLLNDWTGVVWCNPPYGRGIADWIRKGYESAQAGATVVMLIPARTDTAYWHDYVMRAAEVRLLRGRLVFGSGEARANAPFPSALVVFRPGDHAPEVTSMGRGALTRRAADTPTTPAPTTGREADDA